VDKLVWQLPLNARFEFEQTADGEWIMVHYSRDQGKDFQERYPDVLPAMANAANIILKAYVICEMELESEAKEGMH
jgi:hypothetical protein